MQVKLFCVEFGTKKYLGVRDLRSLAKEFDLDFKYLKSQILWWDQVTLQPAPQKYWAEKLT